MELTFKRKSDTDGPTESYGAGGIAAGVRVGNGTDPGTSTCTPVIHPLPDRSIFTSVPAGMEASVVAEPSSATTVGGAHQCCAVVGSDSFPSV